MQAGSAESTMWLGGAYFVRVALVLCLLCLVNKTISRKSMGTRRGGDGQALLQLSHSVCGAMQRHLLPQLGWEHSCHRRSWAEWSVGTGRRAGQLEETCRRAVFSCRPAQNLP